MGRARALDELKVLTHRCRDDQDVADDRRIERSGGSAARSPQPRRVVHDLKEAVLRSERGIRAGYDPLDIIHTGGRSTD